MVERVAVARVAAVRALVARAVVVRAVMWPAAARVAANVKVRGAIATAARAATV